MSQTPPNIPSSASSQAVDLDQQQIEATAAQVPEYSSGHRLSAPAAQPMSQTPQNIPSSASSQAVDLDQQQIGSAATPQTTGVNIEQGTQAPVSFQVLDDVDDCYKQAARIAVLGFYEEGLNQTRYSSLKEARRQYMYRNAPQQEKNRVADPTIPQTDKEKQSVVRIIYDHILSVANNQDGANSAKPFTDGRNRHRVEDIELYSWELLVSHRMKHLWQQESTNIAFIGSDD
jgi:hypothetical protein